MEVVEVGVRVIEDGVGAAGTAGGTGVVGFAEFVAARGPALQRFAYLVTGRTDDAADLVQEALSRAYPRWSRLAATETAEAYVRRSIVNASVSRWRTQRRLVSVEDTEPFQRGHAPDPTAALGDADHAWTLVQTLPPRQRAAVVLRFYLDLTYDEIADALGCPAATARSHIHRATAALRARLAEEDPDD